MAWSSALTSAAILARSNLSLFERPDRLPRALRAMAPWGTNLAGLAAGAAARYPDRVAVHDDGGTMTYRELWARSGAVAARLERDDIGTGSRVGILQRNHRGFIVSLVASAATGADIVLLNTGFAGPQIADVVSDEGIDLLIHDTEFATTVSECSQVGLIDERRLSALADIGAPVSPRREQGAVVILTSGTTGRPKGAARRTEAGAAAGVAALLDRIPLRLGDTQVIAAPLFHAWGLSHLLLGIGRCATNIVARRFDASETLAALDTHDAEILVVVPVMLSRILDLPDEVLATADTSHLRVIASSGSKLGSSLATSALERFGPVLYNLYGSTEVAVATIATPDDLRDHPSTAGRPARDIVVEILGDDGRPVPTGTVGRVFVGGTMRFDGYTNGDTKEQIRGLMSSGDLGHFEDGRLFVAGREDDMIVSGGENVYPDEVEDLLGRHPSIAEVAVVGVDDDDFGQVLAAFVVARDHHTLTVDDVRGHVRDQLARHKVPRHVVFIDELPRNTTGKILRRELTI